MTCEELDRLEALFRKIAGSHYLGGYDAAVWDHAVYKAAPALLAAARERDEQVAELARLREENARLRAKVAQSKEAIVYLGGFTGIHSHLRGVAIEKALAVFAQEPPA